MWLTGWWLHAKKISFSKVQPTEPNKKFWPEGENIAIGIVQAGKRVIIFLYDDERDE